MVVEFCEEKVYGKEFVRGGGGGRSLKELAGKVRERALGMIQSRMAGQSGLLVWPVTNTRGKEIAKSLRLFAQSALLMLHRAIT